MPTAPKNAKVPQDRKPKKEELPVEPTLEELPGYELLKPLAEVPVWDQTPLISKLQKVYEDQEKEAKELRQAEVERLVATGVPREDIDVDSIEVEASFDIDIIGQLVKAVVPFAKDEAEFIKFCSGAGAIERAGALAMAWVGQMGESESSEAS